MIIGKVNCDEFPQKMLMPLWARAIEQQCLQPIIRDAKATELVAAIDYDFNQFAQPNFSLINCCLQSALIDRWVQNYLGHYPDGLIVEIGTGLSTRFERLDNGLVRWFDLDSPAVMELRRQFFQESDRRQFIEMPGTEMSWDWVERVKNSAAMPPLLIAEDLFLFLEKSPVQKILTGLADNFYGSILLFNFISSRWWQNSVGGSWSIPDIYQLHDWDLRYQVLEVKTLKNTPKEHWPRLSWSTKLAYTLPYLGTAHCMIKLGFGYGRTAQRLIKMYSIDKKS
jgi:O-methyltransferase involved in polyketide biosynthesis